MATDRQILANRRNAQKSTGPRTAAGKAVSRWNALKTGIYAEGDLLPNESLPAHAALVQSFQNAYRPAGPVERAHVRSLARAEWQRRRLTAIECRLYSNSPGLAEAFLNYAAELNRIFTRQTGAHRCFHRTLLALIEIQSHRCAAAPTAEIGFVPKNQSCGKSVRACPVPASRNWLRSEILPPSLAPRANRRALYFDSA